MKFPMAPVFLIVFLLGSCSAAISSAAEAPRRVEIVGYDDHAMEPFISRDGRYLLFNNLNEPSVNTDIHYAERQNDFTWLYRGKVNGINTPELEGCPTLDRMGRMFFVSPRNYSKTLCTIYTGRFKDGTVTDVQPVASISRQKPFVVNFDVDVSSDGQTLVFVDSRFWPWIGPRSADLVIATWDGTRFVRLPDSARLLMQVNKQKALQYAPTISADGLTLYFTRLDRGSSFAGPQIYRAIRPSADSAFGDPVHLEGLGDFVEGTALSPDEHLLYFHRKDGKRHNLYAIRLP